MVFILSEVGLPKDYTRPTSSGKQFYRNKFTLTFPVYPNSLFSTNTFALYPGKRVEEERVVRRPPRVARRSLCSMAMGILRRSAAYKSIIVLVRPTKEYVVFFFAKRGLQTNNVLRAFSIYPIYC